MKIIHEGKVPEERLPDYVGKLLTCKRCCAKIVLDENDSIGQEKRPNGKRWVDCPTEGCEATIDIPYFNRVLPFSEAQALYVAAQKGTATSRFPAPEEK